MELLDPGPVVTLRHRKRLQKVVDPEPASQSLFPDEVLGPELADPGGTSRNAGQAEAGGSDDCRDLMDEDSSSDPRHQRFHRVAQLSGAVRCGPAEDNSVCTLRTTGSGREKHCFHLSDGGGAAPDGLTRSSLSRRRRPCGLGPGDTVTSVFVAARLERNMYAFVLPVNPGFWVGVATTEYNREVGIGYRLSTDALIKTSFRKDHWPVHQTASGAQSPMATRWRYSSHCTPTSVSWLWARSRRGTGSGLKRPPEAAGAPGRPGT